MQSYSSIACTGTETAVNISWRNFALSFANPCQDIKKGVAKCNADAGNGVYPGTGDTISRILRLFCSTLVLEKFVTTIPPKVTSYSVLKNCFLTYAGPTLWCLRSKCRARSWLHNLNLGRIYAKAGVQMAEMRFKHALADSRGQTGSKAYFPHFSELSRHTVNLNILI